MKKGFLQKLLSPFDDLSYFYLGRLSGDEAFRNIGISQIIGIMPVIGYGIFFASLADFLHVLCNRSEEV